jgi:hypothetical protein
MRDALARFQRVIGTPPDRLEPPASLASRLPQSVDEAVVIAINNSPSLQATATDIDAAHASHREATASYYPTLELELQGSRNYNRDGVRGINNDASSMVRLTWNVFNGGIDEARRTEAAHRIGSARADTMDTERALAEQPRRAWHALEAARERVDILREQVAANEQVVRTYRQEFSIGVRDLLDVLDSENELFLARSALTSSEHVVEYAVHRVLAGMGQLAAALGAPRPEEAVATARLAAGITPDYAFGERTLVDVHRSAAGAAASRPAKPADPDGQATGDGVATVEDGTVWRATEGAGTRPLITVQGPGAEGDLPEPRAKAETDGATAMSEQSLAAPTAEMRAQAEGTGSGLTWAGTGAAAPVAGAPPAGTISVEEALLAGPEGSTSTAAQVGARPAVAEGEGLADGEDLGDGVVIYWNDPPAATTVATTED